MRDYAVNIKEMLPICCQHLTEYHAINGMINQRIWHDKWHDKFYTLMMLNFCEIVNPETSY
ncbi:hypothetical protein [Clostridium vitabionis]|uniref:hypothetical protein n=1 Tax=Clostridium vitabionis TaxID=2784388 RepID=UPI00188B7B52|nr:hypothetical protein [Clostridium vitabionis]